MNLQIILNVFAAMFIYNIVLASIGKVILSYFLQNSETIQKEKKTFEQRLAEKMKSKENE